MTATYKLTQAAGAAPAPARAPFETTADSIRGHPPTVSRPGSGGSSSAASVRTLLIETPGASARFELGETKDTSGQLRVLVEIHLEVTLDEPLKIRYRIRGGRHQPSAAKLVLGDPLGVVRLVPDALITFGALVPLHRVLLVPARPWSDLDVVQGSSLAPAAMPLPAVQELSPTELRVLRYLPTNLSRPEIASEMSISINTVNTHIRNIYAKLQASDRSSAVRRARDLQLLARRAPR